MKIEQNMETLAPVADKIEQPKDFTFSAENMEQAAKIIAKYPSGCERSAVMPLLYLAQEQHNNWLPYGALVYIAKLLKILPIQVAEVASFYTMFNMKPVGKYLIQICRTPPCYLCGSEGILQACKDFLQIELNQTTSDNRFTLVEVECLGACVNGPIAQINNDYYEKLTPSGIIEILQQLP